MNGIVSQEDIAKLTIQIVDSNETISDEELFKAISQFNDMALTYSMVDLWYAGKITMGWSVEAQDLTLTLAE